MATLRVDQRLLPDTSPLDAHRALLAELNTLTDIDLSTELVLAIPGSRTSTDHWICAAGRRAWEVIERRPHVEPIGQSGATDANILRNRGIPTMRIGLPKVLVDGQELGFAEGMNTVDAASMTTLAELLVRTVVEVCNRDRADL